MEVPYKVPGSNYVQWVDLYTRMAFERIIFLDEEINDSQANSIIALLLYLESEDSSKPISIYINSPGQISALGASSSIAASMAIYDTMQHIKSPVNTICMGLAAGTAALLLAAGTKGSRVCLPNAELVLMPVYARTRGQSTDIEIDAQKVIADRATLVEVLSLHTGQPTDKITKDLDRRFYLTPQEAKEYGLIDKVLESAKDLPQKIPALI